MIYIDSKSKVWNTNNFCKKCGIPRHPKALAGLCVNCIWENNKSVLIETCTNQIIEWGYTIKSHSFDKHEHLVFSLIAPCCGTNFQSVFGNIKKGIQNENNDNIPCPTCGAKKRIAACMQGFMEKYGRDYDEGLFNEYTLKVRQLSNKVYRNHKNEINPENHKRGHNFHLDHIVPIHYCFTNNISVEQCASRENLQILSNIENIKKHSHLTQEAMTLIEKWG